MPTKYHQLTHDEARAFLATMGPDPEAYLTEVLDAHCEALRDAQDLISTRCWTRGEVLAFCAAAKDLNLFAHEDCGHRLAIILGDTNRRRRAEKFVEDPDTWCDREMEIAQDHLLGTALVTVWRAWRHYNDGPVGQWIESLPRVSPRGVVNVVPRHLR